jgi:tetratricopeptide (TPR) repeat protein
MTDEEMAQIEPEFNRAVGLRETNLPESIRILTDLDKRFPNHGAIVCMLGGIYHSMQDWPKALVYYQRGVVLSPKSELASIGLFHSLWHHERFSEALEESRRLIKIKGMTDLYSGLMSDLDNDGVFD